MHAFRVGRARGSRLWTVPLAAASAALMTGTAQAAPTAPAARAPAVHAGAARQAPLHPAAFGGQASLASVSCLGASWCMAVGSYTTTDLVRHSLAMIFNGSAWRTLKNPAGKGLREVACSSTTFCMAAGGPTGAERWNGATWRTMASPKGGLVSLTCASRTFCARIHGGDLVSVWNGASWQDKTNDFCSGSAPGPCWLRGVSCGSTGNCVAVGTWTVSQEPVQNATAQIWNGKKWTWDTELPAIGNPAQANAVSCRGTFCMTAGVSSSDAARASVADADKYDAGVWTGVSPDLGGICAEFGDCAWATVVACGNPASCITLGGPSGSQFWNGSAWQSAKAIPAGLGSGLLDVSCGGSDCLAAGFRTVAGKKRTLAELWNGSAWTIIKTPR